MESLIPSTGASIVFHTKTLTDTLNEATIEELSSSAESEHGDGKRPKHVAAGIIWMVYTTTMFGSIQYVRSLVASYTRTDLPL